MCGVVAEKEKRRGGRAGVGGHKSEEERGKDEKSGGWEINVSRGGGGKREGSWARWQARQASRHELHTHINTHCISLPANHMPPHVSSVDGWCLLLPLAAACKIACIAFTKGRWCGEGEQRSEIGKSDAAICSCLFVPSSQSAEYVSFNVGLGKERDKSTTSYVRTCASTPYVVQVNKCSDPN